jgi:hypothetical protein
MSWVLSCTSSTPCLPNGIETEVKVKVQTILGMLPLIHQGREADQARSAPLLSCNPILETQRSLL